MLNIVKHEVQRCQAFLFDWVLGYILESGLGMQTKNEQIGFRIPAVLKKDLQEMAKREGRTLSQVCEILVAGGLESYKKEGSKYLQRLLSRQKKESSE